MRNLVAIAALAVATPAAAQPVTSPGACAVTISRAPEDVRIVVEGWVKAEPRCASSIDVRIIPTDGGLYILAQDDRGSTRERIVPDAQSAGVLIASWVADDTFPPDKTVVFVPDFAPPATATERPAAMPVASPAAFVDAPPAARRPAKLRKWVSFGPAFNIGRQLGTGRESGGGLRAEVDVKSWTTWSLGLALSRTGWTRDNFTTGYPENYEFLSARDTKAVAYLARTATAGRFQLRASAGAGAVWTHLFGMYSNNDGAWNMFSSDESKLFATAEGSLLASVRLGNWGLHIGPVLTIYSQTFTAHQENVWEPMTETIKRSLIESMVWTGLRHSL
jgi:hypothetical protein